MLGNVEDQARIEQARGAEAIVQVSDPAVPYPSSGLTMSFVEYGNQFINENLDVLITDILKDLTEREIQLMVDVPIHQEDPVVQRTLLIDTVILMMQKSGSFQEHEKHLDLYNALIGSIGLDEAIAKGEIDSTKVLKKRRNDDKDKDPSADPSTTDKTINADETIHNAAMETEEPVADNVVNVEEQPQDDATPKRDTSIWFKQDIVVRPETPNPDWHKEPNADDALEQNWFNEMVNAAKDPITFDDMLGSTIDFTKFAKNRLKKEKLTKADLEGPTFMLLKGTCRNSIELEYNLKQCYLALLGQLD
ncbi:hypothetical protein Tco_0939786 [Tanacetum coccineum]|uniref:Uncharacterized protein n=1 Tax=Tanacetum coccineum TaxID=301880 RepID=A0ABQ5DL45_9ASTR